MQSVIALIFAADRRHDAHVRIFFQRVAESAYPFHARHRFAWPGDDDDITASFQMLAQVRSDPERQRIVFGADKADDVLLGKRVDETYDGNAGRDNLANRRIDRGRMRRHQRKCVRTRGERRIDQRNLLFRIIGFLRHVVNSARPHALRRAVSTHPRCGIGGIGEVLGENRYNGLFFIHGLPVCINSTNWREPKTGKNAAHAASRSQSIGNGYFSNVIPAFDARLSKVTTLLQPAETAE